jgi:hypothetical protein
MSKFHITKKHDLGILSDDVVFVEQANGMLVKYTKKAAAALVDAVIVEKDNVKKSGRDRKRKTEELKPEETDMDT